MSMLTVRDLDPSIKAKLKERAARSGRSMEAEVRDILARAVAEENERPSLADIIFTHFEDFPVELELPDRSTSMQRPFEL